MFNRLAGLAAGLVMLVAVPSAFAGPTVIVRVEGQSGTLAPSARV